MKIHMVKSGDTMYTIAQKYGVKLEQLIATNPQISNPDQIEVGMKVKIPSAAIHEGAPAVDYAHKHVVVQGDSLWKISKAWGLSLKELVDANPQLKNPSVLLTGEVVNIPKSAHMPNHGTSNTMSAAQALVQPNISNSFSPAYVPMPINAPQPTAAQPIMVNETAPKVVETLVQAEVKLPVAAESNNENMQIQGSNPLFMQFNVPAVEATSKVENMPAYELPEWNAPAMPQWEPASAPDYTAKVDCGCGCGEKVSAMPYNQYQAANSSMPAYYIPEPMLGYSMQDPMQIQPQQPMQGANYNPMQDTMGMQQAAPSSFYNPMQFPASAASGSPYGYMVPCYPMGAYGDMSYLHGMQTPYSPWLNSNENMPAVSTLAENVEKAENANINEHMNTVVGATEVSEPVKKRTKVPRKSSTRSKQKQNDRVILHNFIQKKSSSGQSVRELRLSEPWMNR
ncbi:LysM peptidoglycan-binding domain-containing protein [Paenibacillus psychroresistens]|uniref:LysM peptidoglycan-binding domain-containing protein n=1 Tax=Paenibacillus psychroresistens TaxID=1778678 RepID=A0A6B8RIL3_9BACL|nr:LysM peptidoglycan-binding domain-containing protein [Paenibacillus psychroresistens]QGQ95412.1 LysM peptidoglycan-binding domain-containing protein [Paenibacillus psychroresistens]